MPRRIAGWTGARRARGLGHASLCALLWLLAPKAWAQGAPAETVLFSETFSQPVATGIRFDRDGVWSIEGGRLRAVLQNEKQKRSFAYLGAEGWTEYSVDLDVCGLRGVDKGVAVRVEGGRAVVADLRGPPYGDVLMYRGYSKLGRGAATNLNGNWYHLRVEARGARYRVFVNDSLAIDFSERHNKRPRGRIALVAYTGGAGQCEVLYDNVVVRGLR